jgi:ribonuclease HI
MYKLQFDGLFRTLPDPARPTAWAGLMSYAWLVQRNGRQIARGHGACLGRKQATSNTAEYLALIEGLESLLDFGVRNETILIYGDAKGVIEQMRGNAAVNSPTARMLFQRAQRLASSFSNLTWIWQPRKYNRQADALTRHALQQVYSDGEYYESVLQKLGQQKGQSGFLPILNLRVYQPGPL